MCKEVSWEEVVEVLKCWMRGKTPGPDGSDAASDEFGVED